MYLDFIIDIRLLDTNVFVFESAPIDLIVVSSDATMVNVSTPLEFRLNEAYPNPFNPSTNIDFSIDTESYISIKIYDIQGKEIESLIDQRYYSGNHTVSWDASQYPSGIYFVKMVSDNFSDTKKLMLIK